MAEYNKVANEKLYEILENDASALLAEDTGSYFDTIMGLLNHILLSDLGWLTAYRDSNLDLPILKSPILEFDHPGWGKSLHGEFPDLKAHRDSTDDLFIRFVGSTSEECFAGPIEVSRAGRSQTMSFPFGKVLMHLFNHQSHHRGAISQILDQHNIENDFSNVMQLLM